MQNINQQTYTIKILTDGRIAKVKLPADKESKCRQLLGGDYEEINASGQFSLLRAKNPAKISNKYALELVIDQMDEFYGDALVVLCSAPNVPMRFMSQLLADTVCKNLRKAFCVDGKGRAI